MCGGALFHAYETGFSRANQPNCLVSQMTPTRQRSASGAKCQSDEVRKSGGLSRHMRFQFQRFVYGLDYGNRAQCDVGNKISFAYPHDKTLHLGIVPQPEDVLDSQSPPAGSSLVPVCGGCAIIPKFPVLFPVSRESRFRDRFAAGLARQPGSRPQIGCVFVVSSLAGIVLKLPSRSPSEVSYIDGLCGHFRELHE